MNIHVCATHQLILDLEYIVFYSISFCFFLSKCICIWIYYFLYFKVDFPSIRIEFLSLIFTLLSFECFTLGASATLAGLIL